MSTTPKSSRFCVDEVGQGRKASELKQTFEIHRDESEYHAERLEEVCEILGKPARAKTCEAMQSIVPEMQEDLQDFGGAQAA